MTTPADPVSVADRTSGRIRRQRFGVGAPSSKQPLEAHRGPSLRRIGAGASVVWGIVAASIAVIGIVAIVTAPPESHDTSHLAWALIISCSIIGPIAAFIAARFLLRRRDRLAGLALVISVITPTYFAAVLNIPALIFGIALLILPLANDKETAPIPSLQGS